MDFSSLYKIKYSDYFLKGYGLNLIPSLRIFWPIIPLILFFNTYAKIFAVSLQSVQGFPFMLQISYCLIKTTSSGNYYVLNTSPVSKIKIATYAFAISLITFIKLAFYLIINGKQSTLE